MKKDKLIKKQIIAQASSNPSKYFPTKILEKKGFKRYKCTKCSTMFWSVEKRDVCGDTNCVGTYSFIGNSPAKKQFSFPQVYTKWREYIEKRGYQHVNRFPIVARWRDDLDFNIASIIGFQPYVTKGLVAPPAEEITIPQNCLRFGDIDNVGYTGRHFTSFTMIGQLAFKKPKEYNPEKYLKDLLEWFTDIMKIPVEEIQIHEDAWVGGGDCGPSMEFFSRGLEIGNQVYMIYDMSDAEDIKDLKELDIKVLDMGMGQERCCWFSLGKTNSYEAVMPKVCEYLFEKADFKPDWDLYNKFLPYSGLLNLDEIEDIDKVWEEIVKKMGTNLSLNEIKEKIDLIAGIYSIADHSRSLLYALSDGALPSNVKGGYNLRLILRRALDFIYKNKWDIDLYDVIVLQAQELSTLYPELKEELKGIKKIIDIELKKYENHKEKVEQKIKKLFSSKKILEEEDFIKLYISDGITAQEIQDAYKKENKKIKIPKNFFTLVADYFEKKKQSETKDLKNKLLEYVHNIEPTKMEFYNDSYKGNFKSKLIKKFNFENHDYLIFESTIFYPTMGGQACDLGSVLINSKKREIMEVIKLGSVILHKLAN
jgi:alanyl-tRNA synthetase